MPANNALKRRFAEISILFAVALAALIGVIAFLNQTPGHPSQALVYVKGVLRLTISLGSPSPQTYVVDSGAGSLKIEAKGYSVMVYESSCPGQDCVHSGAISRPGEAIVCAPLGIAIYLTSPEEIHL